MLVNSRISGLRVKIRRHASQVVPEYKLCLNSYLYPALMVNMIKELDPYLRRKVVKEPRPTSLDDAVARTWEPLRAANPQASFVPQASQQVAMQAMAPPPQPPQPQQMELDALRHTPNRQSGRSTPFLERGSRIYFQAAN